MPSSKDVRNGRKPALGKGLNSLLGLDTKKNTVIGVSADSDLASTGKLDKRPISNMDEKQNIIIELDIKAIEANPNQPRKDFKEDELNSLAASLKVDGIIQPIIVARSESKDRYMLIAGERRWRAAKLAGLKKIPVIVKEIAPNDRLRIALIENIQRSDLNPIEEASAYLSLIEDFSLTQDECATKVGKDRATIANAMRLLSLPKEVQNDLILGKISRGHGKALLSLDDNKHVLAARKLIVKKDLNVRQTEQLCKLMNKGEDPSVEKAPMSNPDLEYIAENLRSHLRTKVKLAGSGSRGKIEISYFSASELERILAIVGGSGF